MVDIVDFGRRLKQLRMAKNLTQEQLAIQIGMTKSVISAYESSIRYPSYDVLIKLAKIFSVSTDYLLGVVHQATVDITDLSESNRMLIFNLVEALKP